ncbi:MAG TPA: hypothetical protein VLI92_01910 [Candidatus Saccharimonadales bacterium]|nr:hypothetical protein [Candidatus Saccharimonadales bacterium]
MTDLPGMDLMDRRAQRLFGNMSTQVGKNIASRVWTLYQTTNLLYQENSIWTMWGNKRPDGISTGPIPHMAVVAAANAVLGQALFKGPQLRAIIIGALVHDAFKRLEIEWRDPEKAHSFARDSITALFGETVANYAELSGHTAMPTVLAYPGRLDIGLTFWVDNVVVGDEIQSVKQKCDYLDRMAANGKYQYNDEGIAIYGVPYFTFQRWLATVIQGQLATKLNVKPIDSLAQYAAKLVEDILN